MIKNKFLLLRRQKGLTLEQVSSAINVAPSSLKKWEQGGRFPAMKTLKKIAEFYDVDLSFFSDDKGTMNFAPTITLDTLLTMNGEPIWYYGTKKWYLINADEQFIVDSTGEKLLFTELKELYLMKEPTFVETVTIPTLQDNKGNQTPAKPLKRREVLASKEVLVEVISSDEKAAKQLSGIYDVIAEKECVKKGDIKFHLRYLGKQWLAFAAETTE